MEHVKIFEAFAGYGSQSLALQRLADEGLLTYECVGYSEIDKYAIKAFDSLHSNVPNYGDITKVDWSMVPDFDIITWSSPCQDISNAGLQRGLGEGTRSGLIFKLFDVIESKRPKFILMENVKALVSKKFKPDFDGLIRVLKEKGYETLWTVMNAKDYGVPQNRERVFVVAIRDDINTSFTFPKPFELELRLKDVLEEEVEDKYYLEEKSVEGFLHRRDEKDEATESDARWDK